MGLPSPKVESQITAIVVDDHPIFRLGLVQALSLEQDIRVVAEAADGEEALNVIPLLRPQVAVVDINLPRYNGQRVTYQLRCQGIPTRVLLLTGYHDLDQAIHAAANGAAGYASKEIEPHTLVKYVRHIAHGGYVFMGSFMTRQEVLEWVQRQIEEIPSRDQYSLQPYTPLTEREMEVLRLLVCGASNKEIATALYISQQTVKNHITAILRKLGVLDRTQAVSRALYLGWIKLSDLNYSLYYDKEH